MAKKKTNYMSYLPLLAALLGVVALVMLFVPAIAIKDSDTTYTGLQAAFGYTENVAIIGDVVHLNFSFMNLLPYILVLVGIVACVMGYKGNKLAMFVGFVCFVVAAVFFFLSVSFCVPNEGLEDLISGIGGLFGEEASVKDSLTLGAGAIVAGVCSGVAALSIAASSVLKK